MVIYNSWRNRLEPPGRTARRKRKKQEPIRLCCIMIKHGRRINVKSRCHVALIRQLRPWSQGNTLVMLNIKFNTHGKKSQYAGCILSNHHPAFTNARLHGGIETHRQRHWAGKGRNGRGGSCPDEYPAWMIMQQIPAIPSDGRRGSFTLRPASSFNILHPQNSLSPLYCLPNPSIS